MLHRLRTEDLDIVVGTRFHGDVSHIPMLKRMVLKAAVKVSPRGRRLGLTDAHNGLRAFNRKVAWEKNITSNGMAHVAEIVEMMDAKGWRVAEKNGHDPVHRVLDGQGSIAVERGQHRVRFRRAP